MLSQLVHNGINVQRTGVPNSTHPMAGPRPPPRASLRAWAVGSASGGARSGAAGTSESPLRPSRWPRACQGSWPGRPLEGRSGCTADGPRQPSAGPASPAGASFGTDVGSRGQQRFGIYSAMLV